MKKFKKIIPVMKVGWLKWKNDGIIKHQELSILTLDDFWLQQVKDGINPLKIRLSYNIIFLKN